MQLISLKSGAGVPSGNMLDSTSMMDVLMVVVMLLWYHSVHEKTIIWYVFGFIFEVLQIVIITSVDAKVVIILC